jgi:hypothetical protein
MHNMNSLKRLAIFVVIILLLSGEYVIVSRHYFKIVENYEESSEKRLSDLKVEFVISLFYAHYHKWPGPPGPINWDVVTELSGRPSARINSEHIDFFKKVDCPLPRDNLAFRCDDSSGTCSVYETE